MKSHSWTKGIIPLAIFAGISFLAFVLTWQHADLLADWASESNLFWNVCSLACYVVCAFLIVRTYSQLNNPRLYALILLMLPMGAVHFLHISNPPANYPLAPSISKAPKGKQPRISVSRIKRSDKAAEGDDPVKGDEGHLKPGTEEELTRVTQFWPLPSPLAKRFPELPGVLSRLVSRLHSYTFLFFPAAVLIVSFIGAAPSRKQLKFVTFSLGAAMVVVASAMAGLGAGDLRELPWAPGLVGVVSAVGGLAALARWRSPGGVGGAVAGLILFLLPAAMSSAGVDPTRLGLELKRLPAASERVLVLLLPVALLLLVVREWVVSTIHTTKRDALTQIFNKAYAEAIVNQTAETDLGSTYAVAILDIDHFKKVNDTFGHGAGDVVLHEVAQTIQRTVKDRGLVCRTGGEEITVFFPGLDLDEARSICEEARAAVQALNVKTISNKGRVADLNVTLSVGVASNTGDEGGEVHTRVRDVVEAADRAVYVAKRSGRNKVVKD